MSLEKGTRLEYYEKFQKKKSAMTKSIEAFEKLGGDSTRGNTPKEEDTQEEEKFEDPRFIVINATSEAIAKKMSENSGTVFSLCSEARSLLAIVSWLYRKEENDTGNLQQWLERRKHTARQNLKRRCGNPRALPEHTLDCPV